MLGEESIKSAKILIIDDEPINLDILEEILGTAGYNNITLTSKPEEGANYYFNNEFDLVLLDILMPKMDGFSVLKAFQKRENYTEIPVLVLTALNDPNTRLKALQGGARDFITKPFSSMEVLARIQNLLDIRLSQKQLSQTNKILDFKVQERTKELKDTMFEITHRLSIAAEYRDNETGMHIIRMSSYSVEIAKKIGFSFDQCELIRHAAPMHDIGKIGIPDSILLKPGTLEDAEMEEMKTHTLIGAKILEGHPSELLQTAKDIALSHHERWDGKGYPYQIADEKIPIVGRITTIADIFDALTSRRPYKPPWPIDKTKKFIEDNSGIIFDPQVVTAFFEVFPEILTIKNKFQDKF